MPRLVRFGVLSLFIAFIVVACGSRTGLGIDFDEPGSEADSALDRTVSSDGDLLVDRSVRDAIPDRPLFEGGPLDVTVDCPDPTTCDPADPGYIYKCGKRIFQCNSLEQCQQACTGEECGATCVNPCQDTLGQDTSNGCEFFAVETDVAQEAEGVCFAVFVVNQWKTGEPARIQVERDGATLPIEQFTRIPVGTGLNVQYAPYSEAAGLAKDQIAILFLSRDPAAANDPTPSSPRALASCPAGVVPAVVGDAATHGTGRGKAFHIKTNVPVVAYQMLPYGAGRARVTGATLLFPTNVWDKNYIAANAYAAATRIQSDRAAPTLAIVAQSDATHVTISPTSVIQPGGGLAGTPLNVPITYMLNRGEYVQFTQVAELTGSPIVSDQPVAVIGGSTLMDIPVGRDRADSAHQMLPPVRALGNEYVAVRYRSRDTRAEESVPWRVVGAVNGTTLTYEPTRPSGAPLTLAARQMVEFNATGPFVVRSQDAAHPFYFASYMTGGAAFGPAPGGIGDPEFVNVISPAQYLPRYTFFTDPTYPETNLVVVRARDAQTGAFPEVSLDCAGTLSGWRAAGTSGTYEFTRIDLSTGNFVGQNGCNNGVHTMVASFPTDAGAAEPRFGLTVWGWGNNVTYPPDDDPAVDETNPKQTRWVSYGYPAGANLKHLNSVIVPAN